MTTQIYFNHLVHIERIDKEKAQKMASPAYGKRTQCAVVSCNVSFRREIDAATFVGILSRRIPIGAWKFHMMAFFNEQFPDVIRDVMRENGLTLDQLSAVFDTFSPVFQENNFKEFRLAMPHE